MWNQFNVKPGNRRRRTENRQINFYKKRNDFLFGITYVATICYKLVAIALVFISSCTKVESFPTFNSESMFSSTCFVFCSCFQWFFHGMVEMWRDKMFNYRFSFFIMRAKKELHLQRLYGKIIAAISFFSKQ